MNSWRNCAILYPDSAQHGETACSLGTMVHSPFTASFPSSARMSVLTLPSSTRTPGASCSGTLSSVSPPTSIRRPASAMRRAPASLRISQAKESSPALSHDIWDPSHGSTLNNGTDDRPRRYSEPRASRLAQRQIERHRRLAPVADLTLGLIAPPRYDPAFRFASRRLMQPAASCRLLRILRAN